MIASAALRARAAANRARLLPRAERQAGKRAGDQPRRVRESPRQDDGNRQAQLSTAARRALELRSEERQRPALVVAPTRPPPAASRRMLRRQSPPPVA